MTLKDLTPEQAFEIASLCFYNTDWITKEFEFKYQPYIPEWYEDARELVSVYFEGYFAGKNTARYRMDINTNLDINLYYQYGEDKVFHNLGGWNQNSIQKLFIKWGFEPYIDGINLEK